MGFYGVLINLVQYRLGAVSTWCILSRFNETTSLIIKIFVYKIEFLLSNKILAKKCKTFTKKNFRIHAKNMFVPLNQLDVHQVDVHQVDCTKSIAPSRYCTKS